MSFQAMCWATEQVIPDGEAKGSAAKFVLLMLANRAGVEDWACYPSVQLLVEETQLSESTVRRALTHLEQLGLIEAEDRRRANGTQTSSVYRLQQTVTLTPGSLSPRQSATHEQTVTVTPPEPVTKEPVTKTSNQSPAPRKRDGVWEVLAFIEGFDYSDPEARRPNGDERGKLNRAVKLVKESRVDEELLRRCVQAWPEVMGDALCTARGVSTNIGRLAAAVESGRVARADRGQASIADLGAEAARRFTESRRGNDGQSDGTLARR